LGADSLRRFRARQFQRHHIPEHFFHKAGRIRNEAIYFHELIHVIQWRILGPEQFLRLYADGLERFGYGDSPLEVMAYDAEAAFVAEEIFDAEQLVAQKLS
jgi:hypothetical protein